MFRIPEKNVRIDADDLEAVLVDATEQPVNRPERRPRRSNSGKKRHTVKRQVVVTRERKGPDEKQKMRIKAVSKSAKGLEFGSLRIREGGAGHETFYPSPATCLVCVKGNQKGLRDAVAGAFERAGGTAFADCDMASGLGAAPGRDEERYVTVVHDPEGLPKGWTDVGSVARVCRGGRVTGQEHQSGSWYPGRAHAL